MATDVEGDINRRKAEQPAASICAGYDADGMPIGLQIVGHRFDDVGVLRMARAYETMRPPQRAWPEAELRPRLHPPLAT
jgi:Asp-tRNA(Asn)/Glu-tRNA(Gln) amidotransferase A subunit family amidase